MVTYEFPKFVKVFRNVTNIEAQLYESHEQYLMSSEMGKPFKEYKSFRMNDHLICVFGGPLNPKCKLLLINLKREDVQSCSNSEIDADEFSYTNLAFHRVDKRIFIIANKGKL
jgi:hypothetical protein